MDLNETTRERIEGLVRENPVLLIMKGNREAPQCGFSATVVRILDGLVPDYATADVLQDAELRDGIKIFSSWPTIPQLYIGGEFIGGCDIIQELFQSGELLETLGVEVNADAAPEVNMTQAAALKLQEVMKTQAPEGHTLHLQIDARFAHHLHLAPPMPGEIAIEGPGLTLYFDLQSASRADGIRIDVVEGEGDTGFHIENPNAPQVHPLAPSDLKQWLGDDRRFEIIDVRSPEERALASLDGSVLLTPEEAQRIESLPRDTTLVFYCKSGVRSQQAAETFSRKGFGDVHNLVGGLDAWLELSEA